LASLPLQGFLALLDELHVGDLEVLGSLEELVDAEDL
jgi:hypothetical protein